MLTKGVLDYVLITIPPQSTIIASTSAMKFISLSDIFPFMYLQFLMGDNFDVLINLAGYCLQQLLGIFLFRCLYRLTLHPLAQVPGPILNRISSWPDFSAAASGNRHVRLWQLHEIYGPVVRVAPNVVSFNTIEAHKTIYDPKANVRNGRYHDTLISSNGGRADILSADGETHARKRKIILRAFSEKALRMNEPTVLEHQREWLDKVTRADNEDAWSKLVLMSQCLPYLTTDIVAEIGFSRNFGLTKNEQWRYLPETFTGLVATSFKIGYLPPLLQRCVNALLRSPIMAALIPPEIRNFFQFTDSLIAQRVEQELNGKSAEAETRDDFVHLFREHEDSLNNAAIDEIKAEPTVLLVAGSDTVATAMSAILFYLTHNPQCLERAAAEIRSIFASVDDIKRGPELSPARYLRACIDESLRLSPSTPGLIPRLVLKGGMVVEGQPIPAGTEVGVAAYTIHLNPTYCPRPFEFLSDRWLEESDNESPLTLARSAFAAFSTGCHSCVGKELAYMEMTLLVARIMHQYDIKLPDDGETKRTAGEGLGPQGPWGRRVKGQYQIIDHFTAKANGPWIRFRRRK